MSNRNPIVFRYSEHSSGVAFSNCKRISSSFRVSPNLNLLIFQKHSQMFGQTELLLLLNVFVFEIQASLNSFSGENWNIQPIKLPKNKPPYQYSTSNVGFRPKSQQFQGQDSVSYFDRMPNRHREYADTVYSNPEYQESYAAHEYNHGLYEPLPSSKNIYPGKRRVTRSASSGSSPPEVSPDDFLSLITDIPNSVMELVKTTLNTSNTAPKSKPSRKHYFPRMTATTRNTPLYMPPPETTSDDGEDDDNDDNGDNDLSKISNVPNAVMDVVKTTLNTSRALLNPFGKTTNFAPDISPLATNADNLKTDTKTSEGDSWKESFPTWPPVNPALETVKIIHLSEPSQNFYPPVPSRPQQPRMHFPIPSHPQQPRIHFPVPSFPYSGHSLPAQQR